MDSTAWAARFDDASSNNSHATTDYDCAVPSTSPHLTAFATSARNDTRKSVRAASSASSDRSVGEGVFVVSKKGPSWLSERQFSMLGDRPGSQTSIRQSVHPLRLSHAATYDKNPSRLDCVPGEEELSGRNSGSSDAHSVNSAHSWPVLPNESRRKELRNSKMIMMAPASPSISISVLPSPQLRSQSQQIQPQESPSRSSASVGGTFFMQRFYDPYADDEDGSQTPSHLPVETPKEELSQEYVYRRRSVRSHPFIQAFQSAHPANSSDDEAGTAQVNSDSDGMNRSRLSHLYTSIGLDEMNTEAEEREYWSDSRSSNRSGSSMMEATPIMHDDGVRRHILQNDLLKTRHPSESNNVPRNNPRLDAKRSAATRARPLMLPQMATLTASTMHRRRSGQLHFASRRSSVRIEQSEGSSVLAVPVRNAHSNTTFPPIQGMTRVRSSQAQRGGCSDSADDDESSSDSSCSSQTQAAIGLSAATVAEVKVAKKAITRTDAMLLLNTKLPGWFSMPTTPIRQFKEAGSQTMGEEMTVQHDIGAITLGSRRARPQLTIITENSQQHKSAARHRGQSRTAESLLSLRGSDKSPSSLASTSACCPQCGHNFHVMRGSECGWSQSPGPLDRSTPPAPHSARQLAHARIQARALQRQEANMPMMYCGSDESFSTVCTDQAQSNAEPPFDTAQIRKSNFDRKTRSVDAESELEVVEATEVRTIADGWTRFTHHSRENSLRRRQSKDSVTSLEYRAGKRSSGTSLGRTLRSKLSDVHLTEGLRLNRFSKHGNEDSSSFCESLDRPQSQTSFTGTCVGLNESVSFVSASAFDEGQVENRLLYNRPRRTGDIGGLQRPSNLEDGLGPAKAGSGTISHIARVPSISTKLPNSFLPAHTGITVEEIQSQRTRVVDTEVCPWEAQDVPPASQTKPPDSVSNYDSDHQGLMPPKSATNTSSKALKLLGLADGPPVTSPLLPGPTFNSGEKGSTKKDRSRIRGPRAIHRRLSSSNISGPFDVMHVSGSSKSSNDKPAPYLLSLKGHQSSLDLTALAKTGDLGTQPAPNTPAKAMTTSQRVHATEKSNASFSPNTLAGVNSSQALKKMRQAWKKSHSSSLSYAEEVTVPTSIPGNAGPVPSIFRTSEEESEELTSTYRLPSLDLPPSFNASHSSRVFNASSLNFFGDGPLLEALESTAAAALALSRAECQEGAQVIIEIQSPQASKGASPTILPEDAKELQLAQNHMREQETYKRSSSTWNPRVDYL